MSDLVADAEDLLHALAGSSNPQLQVLRARLVASVEDMKWTLRQRLKTSAPVQGDAVSHVFGAVANHYWLFAGAAILTAALLRGLSTRAKV